MKRVTVTSLPGHDYAVTLNDGRHEGYLSDEPEPEGGDLGPSPYELLLHSLGACKVITMEMYAKRKQWPLAAVSVELTHEKVLARDCSDCTPEEREALGPTGRVDVIRAQIALEGPLDPDQRARLLEISERCPVHRTLLARPKIVTTLAET